MQVNWGLKWFIILRHFREVEIKKTFTGKSLLGGEQEGYVIRNVNMRE
jgi:hypothetical protein